MKLLLRFSFICSLLLFPFSTFSQMQHIEGEIIIQMKAGNNAIELVELINQEQSINLNVDRLLSAPMNAWLLNFNPSDINEEDLLRFLRSNELVSIAQFNHIVKDRDTIPNDTQINSQWHHKNVGNNGGTEDADIDSDLAWDITTGGLTALGDTIVVCVIEGGNLNHEDLTDNAWVNINEIPNNDIDDDGNGFIDDYLGWNVNSQSDGGVLQGGHGTSVMGMIGATGNNGMGVAGANWDVKIMSVAGESLSNEASVVEAYNYPLIMRRLYNETEGEQGAFVVATNASWGIDEGDPSEMPIWSAFYDTLGTAGILNCGATTNDNLNVDIVGDIPTAAPSDYMISVTASNRNDVRTFSGYGATTIDVAAPGENIFTTNGSVGYGSTSGTSFASPLTAGVIALLYSAPCEDFINLVKNDPQSGADYVRSVLFAGVDVKPNLIGETVTGGRINSYNSLMLISNTCGNEDCLPPFQLSYEVDNDTLYTVNWSGTVEDEGYFNLRYREEDAEEWIILDSLQLNSISFESLAWCETYEFQIAKTCNADTLIYSPSLFLETNGCCQIPSDFILNNISDSSAVVSWLAFLAASEYELQYRPEDEEDWTSVGIFDGSSAVVLNNLDTCSNYEIRLLPDCGNPDSEEFAILSSFKTKGCGFCTDNEFCEASGQNTEDEYIESVTIAGFENSSGNNDGYALFEETGIELVTGQTYPLNLVPGYSGQSYSEYFMVWIDANMDGLFTEDEVIYDAGGSVTSEIDAEFTLSDTAFSGYTRLRVSMKYVGFTGSAPGPCSNFVYGEVEDYCVTLISGSTGVKESDIFDNVSVYPNPANDVINVNFRSMEVEGKTDFIMLDALGRVVKQENLNSGNVQLNVADLNAGIYFYYLKNNHYQSKAGKIVIEN